MTQTTATWKGLVEPVTAKKSILNVEVRTQQTNGRWLRVIADLPKFDGEFHFIATDQQEAEDIFNCINEDKIFMLLNCRRRNEKIVRLVRLGITRRIGYQDNTE